MRDDETEGAPVATNLPQDVPPEDEPATTEDQHTEEDAATDDAPEAPAPSSVHPAAAPGFEEADVNPEMGQFFIGMWYTKPNYGCPYCAYASIEGSGDVELHILSKIDSGDIKHRVYLDEQ